MFLPSVREIQVESLGNEVTYVLPVRPLGKLRLVGLIPIVFILGLWMPLGALRDSLHHAASGSGSPFDWILTAFLVVFCCFGLIPIWFGLVVLAGHARLEWRNKRLAVANCVGPLRWRRRISKQPIRKLVVMGGAESASTPQIFAPLSNLGALTVEFETGKPRVILFGYPRAWLQAMANDFASRIGATSVAGRPIVEIKVVAKDAEPPPEAVDVTTRPPRSRVNIENSGAGLKITVPAAGLIKGSKGLFFFAQVWCAFIGAITGLMIFSKSGPADAIAFLLVIPFWLIGLGLLAGAINMGRRHATITVSNSELNVMQSGPFGTKIRAWRRSEVATVCADKSGMEVNGRPVLNLQIRLVQGTKAGFFAGRDEEELRWLATELRKALNIRTAKPTELSPDVV
jgi:hypothetical protein